MIRRLGHRLCRKAILGFILAIASCSFDDLKTQNQKDNQEDDGILSSSEPKGNIQDGAPLEEDCEGEQGGQHRGPPPGEGLAKGKQGAQHMGPPPGQGPGKGQQQGGQHMGPPPRDGSGQGRNSQKPKGCRPKNGQDKEKQASASVPSECTTNIAEDLPDWIKDNFTCIEAYQEGDYYVIKSNGVPNHKSYYFGQSDSRYEDMPEGNHGNPNMIQAQSYVFSIPVSPQYNETLTASNMGPIGIAINGVALFNNQAAPGDSLAEEINTFDRGNGHPTQTGMYHYHMEPSYLSNNDNHLIGVLRDGFQVYGKLCSDGKAPTDLDETNGHYGSMDVYHHHATDSDPYISSAYRGNPGTLSQ